MRQDHSITVGTHTLSLSAYIPQGSSKCVLYLHTHSGMALEGTDVARPLVSAGIGCVLFDFRGNGLSTGEYVSFGWHETFDLHAVVGYLREKMGIKEIVLWGRSMGAATAIFYASTVFRQKHGGKLPLAPDCIRGMVLDSPFTDLTENIKRFVDSKASSVPGFVVDLALKYIEDDVRRRIGVSLAEISPCLYYDGLRYPTFIFASDKDELVSLQEIETLFRHIKNPIKKLRVVRGTHSEERPHYLTAQGVSFVSLLFGPSTTSTLPTRSPLQERSIQVLTNTPSTTLTQGPVISARSHLAPQPVQIRTRSPSQGSKSVWPPSNVIVKKINQPALPPAAPKRKKTFMEVDVESDEEFRKL